MAPTARSPAKALRGVKSAAARMRADVEPASPTAVKGRSVAAGAAAEGDSVADGSSPAAGAGLVGADGCGGSSEAVAQLRMGMDCGNVGQEAMNPWHVLWATTAACPAWEQRPLQVGEGARVCDGRMLGTAHGVAMCLATQVHSVHHC